MSSRDFLSTGRFYDHLGEQLGSINRIQRYSIASSRQSCNSRNISNPPPARQNYIKNKFFYKRSFKWSSKAYQNPNLITKRIGYKIPIRDQLFIVIGQILNEIIEEALDRAQTREYLKQAPELMADMLLGFTELALSQAMVNVEREDFVGNTFGENMTPEPVHMVSDNWIRNKIKNVAKKVESHSTISRQIRDTRRNTALSTSIHHKLSSQQTPQPRLSVKSVKRERSNKLPEPVEIDYYVEGDYLEKDEKFREIFKKKEQAAKQKAKLEKKKAAESKGGKYNGSKSRGQNKRFTFNYEGEKIMIKNRLKADKKLTPFYVKTTSKVTAKIVQNTQKQLNETEKKININKKRRRGVFIFGERMKRKAFLSSFKKFADNAIERQRQSKEQRYLVENADRIFQNFRLREGVTLKTKNYILKNKRGKNSPDFLQNDGKRRVRKRFFDKNLKGRRTSSAALYRRSTSKGTNRTATGRAKGARDRSVPEMGRGERSGAKNREESLELVRRLNVNIGSSVTSQSNLASSRNMRIYLKNYQKFLADAVEMDDPNNFRFSRIHSYHSETGSVGRGVSARGKSSTKSGLVKEEMQEDDDDMKVSLMNLRMKERKNYRAKINRPVDMDYTSKELVRLHRRKAKRSQKKKGLNVRRRLKDRMDINETFELSGDQVLDRRGKEARERRRRRRERARSGGLGGGSGVQARGKRVRVRTAGVAKTRYA